MSVTVAVAVLNILTAGLGLSIAIMGGRRHSLPGRRAYIGTVIALVVWAFCDGVAILVSDDSFMWWVEGCYLGVATSAVLWLIFTARYTRQDAWLTRPVQVLSAVIPGITIILAFTNHFHGLIWSSITTGPAGLRIYTHGPWFWVVAIYNYVAMMSSAVFLLIAVRRHPALYLRPVLFLIGGSMIPWINNAIYIFGLSPIPGVDFTPLAFSLSTFIGAWGVLRYNLFDVVPLARDALAEHMDDGVIVLDTQDYIADINPAALRLLRVASGAALNRAAGTTFAAWPSLLQCLEPLSSAPVEVKKEGAEESPSKGWWGGGLSFSKFMRS